ncbi:hypothetical protein N665_0287s0003 [Sinapis alba]|nr:hypothetical protein N665_0287s0003 [Sinapis alba]
MGACTRCGRMDHSANDCPSPERDSRTCYHCGQKGHWRRDCPKMQSGQSKGRAEASKPVQNRGQTSAPHVYELSNDKDEAQPYKAITGTLSIGGVETHVLFDIGAIQFCESRYGRKGNVPVWNL